MLVHLIEHDLLTKSQRGFIAKRSCFTNLLSFWRRLMNEWIRVRLYVPHKRLLLKIKSYGISGMVYRWIKAWLIGRKQRVTLVVKQSDWVMSLRECHRVQCWRYYSFD